MNKQIMQFRYYWEKNKNNYPFNSRKSDFTSGEIFKEFYPIHFLRIQGGKETKFFINSGSNPVKIGTSGIYVLDLQDFTIIEDLYFSDIKIDNENPLIIDIIYG